MRQSYSQYIGVLCESDADTDDDANFQLQQGLAASLAASEQPHEPIRCVDFRNILSCK